MKYIKKKYISRDWASANATFVSSPLLKNKNKKGRAVNHGALFSQEALVCVCVCVSPLYGTHTNVYLLRRPSSFLFFFFKIKSLGITCAASFFYSLIIQVGHRPGGGPT
jgi:hypothetical protein